MDSGKNGQPEKRSLREQYEELIKHDDSKLLPDLSGRLEGLRRFLVGGEFEGRRWPAGRMAVSRKGREMCLTLTLDDFEIQCSWYSDTLEELLSRANGDLERKCVSWDRTWSAKERERQQFRSACRGGS